MDLIVLVPMATDYNILYDRKDKAIKTRLILCFIPPFLLLEKGEGLNLNSMQILKTI